MDLPFHLSAELFFNKEICDQNQEHLFDWGLRQSAVPVAHSLWQWRSREQRARWDVVPKADATTNQFRPRCKVCSHCRECGDATSVQLALHAQTPARREAACPRALVPVRWWPEAH